ncbi:MAG TPA: hypothetical protein VJK54_06230, partial [Chthoniobacterales bacterium]|nr:hypothetical protein [Chthoniobacterales bacterium]
MKISHLKTIIVSFGLLSLPTLLAQHENELNAFDNQSSFLANDSTPISHLGVTPKLMMNPSFEEGTKAVGEALGIFGRGEGLEEISSVRVGAEGSDGVGAVSLSSSANQVLRLRGGGPKSKNKPTGGLKSTGDSSDEEEDKDDTDITGDQAEAQEVQSASTYLKKEICNNIYEECVAKVASMSLNRSRFIGGELEEDVQEAKAWAAAETEATFNVEKAERNLEIARRETEEAGKNNPTTSAVHEVKRLAEKFAEAKVEMAYATRHAIEVRNSAQSEAAEAKIAKAKTAEISASIGLQKALKTLRAEKITDGGSAYAAAIVATFSAADALWQEGDQKTTESYNKNATDVERNAAKSAAQAVYNKAKIEENAAREVYKNAVMAEVNEVVSIGGEASKEEWDARVAALEQEARSARVQAETTKKQKDKRIAERTEAIAAANRAARDAAEWDKNIAWPAAKATTPVKNLHRLQPSTTSLSPIAAKSSIKKEKREFLKELPSPQGTQTEEKQESFVAQFSKEIFRAADQAWGKNSKDCFDAKKAPEGPLKEAIEIRRKNSFNEARDAEAGARAACGVAMSKKLDGIVQTQEATAQEVWNAIIVEAEQAVEQAKRDVEEKDSAKNKTALERAVIIIEAMKAAYDSKWTTAKTVVSKVAKNVQVPSFRPIPPSDHAAIAKPARVPRKDQVTLQQNQVEEKVHTVVEVAKKIFKDADEAWWQQGKAWKQYKEAIGAAKNTANMAQKTATDAAQKAEASARAAYPSAVMVEAMELLKTKGPSAQELWNSRVAEAKQALVQAQAEVSEADKSKAIKAQRVLERAEIIVAAERDALNAIVVEIRAEVAFNNAETAQTESAWIDAENNAQAAEAIWSQVIANLQWIAHLPHNLMAEEERNRLNEYVNVQKAKWADKTALANFKMAFLKKDQACAKAANETTAALADERAAEAEKTEAAWTTARNSAQLAEASWNEVLKLREYLAQMVPAEEKEKLISEVEQTKAKKAIWAEKTVQANFNMLSVKKDQVCAEVERASATALASIKAAETAKTEAAWATALNHAQVVEGAWDQAIKTSEQLLSNAPGEEKEKLETAIEHVKVQKTTWAEKIVLANFNMLSVKKDQIYAEAEYASATALASIKAAEGAKTEAAWATALNHAQAVEGAWNQAIKTSEQLLSNAPGEEKEKLKIAIEHAKVQKSTWIEKTALANFKMASVKKDQACAEAESASATALASIKAGEGAKTEAAWITALNHAQAVEGAW